MSLHSVPAFYPVKRRRWRRIHTAIVIATMLNFVFLAGMGAFTGRMVEDTIYEVNMTDVIQTDAEVRAPEARKRVVLAPAPRAPLTIDPRKAGGGAPAPAPAPAPGQRPDRPLAQAPPPLKIDAPKVVDLPAREIESQPSVVAGRPQAPDASYQGNPEGVTGGKGSQDSEGPGGTGTGGTGTGGNGTGGNGTGGNGAGGAGTGSRFERLVNRVRCMGCHQRERREWDKSPWPYQIEKAFNAVRWRDGGEKHDLILSSLVNEQGYIEDVQVVVSSGNPEVDQSAVEFIQGTHWYPARKGGCPTKMWVDMPLQVFF